MFGSKNLLFAYGLGVFGLVLTTGALSGTLELPQLLLFMFGLVVRRQLDSDFSDN